MSKAAGKNSQATRAKQLILGTQKHYPNASDTLYVGGATYTVTALTKLFQDFVDLREAVEVSRAALRAKIEAERTHAPSLLAVIHAFEAIVRGAYGSSDALADFGLVPHKARAPLSAEKKAVANAKRQATRAARLVISKDKKRQIKGAVSAALVVTPESGPQPITQPITQPPAPAGPAPSAGTTPHVP